MKTSEIVKIIKSEINSEKSISNPHEAELDECLLVAPTKEIFIDTFKEGDTIELWVVLETNPEIITGYRIVFDDSKKKSGLALSYPNKQGMFLGFNGTFLQALASM